MSEKSTNDLLSELAADHQKAKNQPVEQPVQQAVEQPVHQPVEQPQQPVQQPEEQTSGKSTEDTVVPVVILVSSIIGVILCLCKVCSWWWMFGFVFGPGAIAQIMVDSAKSQKK